MPPMRSGVRRFQEGSIEALGTEVQGREWYHTIELAPGIVTPGWFDARTVVHQLPVPASLAGKRCLDVATFDGFWAFEMERRGAEEVLAIDLLDLTEADWPPNTTPETIDAIGRRKGGGRGFEIAKHWLGSSVERREMNVYDVDAETLGTFDFIYLGSLLLHLRDPVKALERLRRVCVGELLIVDSIDLLLTILFRRRPIASLDVRGRPWWWTCNVAGLVRLAEAARFRLVGEPQRVFMPPGQGQPLPPLRPSMLYSNTGREAALKRFRGDPHAALRLAPA
jgi:tRNA (mo5U34)-methyltransferase